jgi:multisubunit Na+/H+ antiporter MnhG subunit
MLSPARLTEILVEFVFLLLGALLVWLAANRRIAFDNGSRAWLLLSFALIAWGAIALARPGELWRRWQKWNRGGSLVLLGLVMLAMSRAPFGWIFPLMIFAGLLLLVRGSVGCLLILRQH